MKFPIEQRMDISTDRRQRGKEGAEDEKQRSLRRNDYSDVLEAK